MVEPEAIDALLDAEEVVAAAAAAVELPLEAAVELAASEAHEAAVGRLFTPWPAQSESANWRVSTLVFSRGQENALLCVSLLSWSAALQALLTQHERPAMKSVLLQMHLTSRPLQEPNESPTQLAAQSGRPGICAAAREVRRATAVRVKACMIAVCLVCRYHWYHWWTVW